MKAKNLLWMSALLAASCTSVDDAMLDTATNQSQPQGKEMMFNVLASNPTRAIIDNSNLKEQKLFIINQTNTSGSAIDEQFYVTPSLRKGATLEYDEDNSNWHVTEYNRPDLKDHGACWENFASFDKTKMWFTAIYPISIVNQSMLAINGSNITNTVLQTTPLNMVQVQTRDDQSSANAINDALYAIAHNNGSSTTINGKKVDIYTEVVKNKSIALKLQHIYSTFEIAAYQNENDSEDDNVKITALSVYLPKKAITGEVQFNPTDGVKAPTSWKLNASNVDNPWKKSSSLWFTSGVLDEEVLEEEDIDFTTALPNMEEYAILSTSDDPMTLEQGSANAKLSSKIFHILSTGHANNKTAKTFYVKVKYVVGTVERTKYIGVNNFYFFPNTANKLNLQISAPHKELTFDVTISDRVDYSNNSHVADPGHSFSAEEE